ncbi:VOC family protein [Kinneretia aquatilis]|jgi:hypothetical protein|uniref:VOC family protein n=1 Tax=Kinneretia aquatilis TaxID=2070761 RepID=UPI00149533E4|nr:VOC family protein [Paucibacter aquatile]WIV97164.1 VOC family protein [Paucibacter aquatile]
MAHVLDWFELPVTDFARAKAFYEAVLGRSVTRMDMGGITLGMLGSDADSVGGALVCGEGNVPSSTGSLVYLNGGEDLAIMLARVEAAGGRILVPKTDIGQGFGFFAHFLDCEGNKVGLHSMG